MTELIKTTKPKTILGGLARDISKSDRIRSSGRVTAVRGSVMTAQIPHTAIGDLCIISRRNKTTLRGQVVSFLNDEVCVAPFDDAEGISPGAEIYSTGAAPTLSISDSLIGTIVNCFAEPISVLDSSVRSVNVFQSPYNNPVPPPLERSLIRELLETGIAAIDGVCTLGYGQRIGLFAGAGVGKSTLLGMIAKRAAVDISVIALIGERGREVREFVEECLGEEGMKRAVLVVSTSDEAPIRRALAIETATAIAEYFRARGKRVMLMVDSLTRAARALRDVGLGAGELPIRQGYTPSVFAKLPKILERAGADKVGSITGIYTVLTNAESEIDPLRDEVKSLLDGHIILDPQLAERGVRPAIDLTTSISRVMQHLHSAEYLKTAETVRAITARLKRDKDLLLFGGTADRELAAAIAAETALLKALTQLPSERRPCEETFKRLGEIAKNYREAIGTAR